MPLRDILKTSDMKYTKNYGDILKTSDMKYVERRAHEPPPAIQRKTNFVDLGYDEVREKHLGEARSRATPGDTT